MIRRQRNELGHPQDQPPETDRETAFVFFRLFPGYLKAVESLVAYARSNGL